MSKAIYLYKIIIDILFKIIVFFMVFDGIRDALIFSGYISFIKELSVLLLLFLTFVHMNYRFVFTKDMYTKGLLFLASTMILFLPHITNTYSLNKVLASSFTIYYKYVQFFVLIYLFLNYQKFTSRSIEGLIDYFLILIVIFVLITPVFYFAEPSFLKSNFKQWGRIGVGYPTMDAQVLMLALVIVLFHRERNYIYAVILLLLILFGILMQNTGTGYVSFFGIVTYYFFSSKRKNLKSVTTTLIIVTVSFISILIRFYEMFENFFWLMNDKLMSIFSSTKSLSEEIREEQYLELKNSMSYLTDYLFGLGFNIYVENQYSFMILGFGYVGFIFFILFLLYFLLNGWNIHKLDNSIMFLVTIIFGLTSYTLVSLYLFPTEVIFAFGIGISKHLYYNKKKEFKLEISH